MARAGMTTAVRTATQRHHAALPRTQILKPAVRLQFHESMLNAARQLAREPSADQFRFGAAILIAGTACEVAAEQALTAFIDSKPDLPSEVLKLVTSFSLRDERVRGFWNATTGDLIQDQVWWQRYTEHVKRRNAVAHGGLLPTGSPPTRQSADASLKVAQEFVAHIGRVLTTNGLAD